MTTKQQQHGLRLNELLSIYQQLEMVVAPVLTANETDLTIHDRNSIINNPGLPFLHWTYPLGTHMVFLFPFDSVAYPPPGEFVPYLFGTADRDKILNDHMDIARYFIARPGYVCHYFEPGAKNIRAITTERAVEIIRQYIASVRYSWNKRS